MLHGIGVCLNDGDFGCLCFEVPGPVTSLSLIAIPFIIKQFMTSYYKTTKEKIDLGSTYTSVKITPILQR